MPQLPPVIGIDKTFESSSILNQSAFRAQYKVYSLTYLNVSTLFYHPINLTGLVGPAVGPAKKNFIFEQLKLQTDQLSILN